MIKLINGDGNILIRCEDKKISFSFDDIQITSKLIDGKFPDYNRVLGMEGNNNAITVDKNELLSTVKRVGIVAESKVQGVLIGTTKNLITISSSNSSGENSNDTIEVEYDGTEQLAGFNFTYLIAPLLVIPDGDIEFNLSNKITITSKIDTDCIFVIMSMRV